VLLAYPQNIPKRLFADGGLHAAQHGRVGAAASPIKLLSIAFLTSVDFNDVKTF
jgi:hypothetical protein